MVPWLGSVIFIGNRPPPRFTRRVSENKNHAAIAGSLLLVVLLWGGNNAGTKWVVGAWPPVSTGTIPLRRPFEPR